MARDWHCRPKLKPGEKAEQAKIKVPDKLLTAGPVVGQQQLAQEIKPVVLVNDRFMIAAFVSNKPPEFCTSKNEDGFIQPIVLNADQVEGYKANMKQFMPHIRFEAVPISILSKATDRQPNKDEKAETAKA
jgi:hypothetical protein